MASRAVLNDLMVKNTFLNLHGAGEEVLDEEGFFHFRPASRQSSAPLPKRQVSGGGAFPMRIESVPEIPTGHNGLPLTSDSNSTEPEAEDEHEEELQLPATYGRQETELAWPSYLDGIREDAPLDTGLNDQSLLMAMQAAMMLDMNNWPASNPMLPSMFMGGLDGGLSVGNAEDAEDKAKQSAGAAAAAAELKAAQKAVSRMNQVKMKIPETPESGAPVTKPSSKSGSSPPADWADKTTLMMRNLANKYSQQTLLEELNSSGFLGCYDFIYLPIDPETKANRGYAFINFTSPTHSWDFKQAFEGKQMTRYNSDKVVSVSPAALQGFDANYAHYSRARVNRGEPAARPLFLREPSTPYVNSNSRSRRGRRNTGSLIDAAVKNQSFGRGMPQREGGSVGDSSAPKFCYSCGGKREVHHAFCQFCGTAL